jgi:hypothetical protein
MGRVYGYAVRQNFMIKVGGEALILCFSFLAKFRLKFMICFKCKF